MIALREWQHSDWRSSWTLRSAATAPSGVHRPELVTCAVTAATARYSTFATEQVVVIGDTPRDVEAALVNNAVAVGVATGNYTVEELTAAGAHTVLADLDDLDAVRRAVLG